MDQDKDFITDITEFLTNLSATAKSMSDLVGGDEIIDDEQLNTLIEAAGDIAEAFDVINQYLKEEGKDTLTQLQERDIPTLSREEILEKLRVLIKAGVLKQSDKYLRLRDGFIPTLSKNTSYGLSQGEYRVDAYYWSDSAVYYDVYLNGGSEMSVVDFLNACSERGAVTKTAWGDYAHDKSLLPSYFIERYRIEEHVRLMFLASGTYDECVESIKAVYEWNRNHIGPLSEMIEDKELNFIRINRKKGEIESTRCMNGDCLGVMFMSVSAENSY